MLETARCAGVVGQCWILMHSAAAYRRQIGNGNVAEWQQWNVPSDRDLGSVWCCPEGHRVSPLCQFIAAQAGWSGVGQSPSSAEAVTVLPACDDLYHDQAL